jgi:plastocyanin
VRRLLAGVLVAGLLGPAAAPAGAVTRKIVVGDNYFVRPEGVPKVRVQKGTRVKWVWIGEIAHGVSTESGPVTFFSDIMVEGTFSKKLRRRGTYTLYCPVHSAGDQSMKLIVR